MIPNGLQNTPKMLIHFPSYFIVKNFRSYGYESFFTASL